MRETAITIDHEEDLALVDTTLKGIASALRRAGFEEVTRPDSRPYRRFQGQADQVRFRKSKAAWPDKGGRKRGAEPSKKGRFVAQDSPKPVKA